MTNIAIITDNDFDKVNGVTTTLKAVLRHAPDDLHVRVYTMADLAVDQPDYCAMASWGVGLPWYPEMRIYWPHIQQLRRRLKADGAQVLHLTTPGPMGLAARWVWRRAGSPMVGSYHTHLGDYVATFSGSVALGRGLEAYMRWLYEPCERVLVPSSATQTRLRANGYRHEQLHVWSRGVDTSCFRPTARSMALRESWRVGDNRPAILYAGRLSSEKGLALVGPIQQALLRRRLAHQFVFVGDGPMRPALAAICPEAVFLGSLGHAQVAQAMASADVFLFPSATDSLGNVVLEAQASGLPVLVTDQGGPQEHMVHGQTGWVCPNGNAEAFVDRLAAWLVDAASRRAMGEAAVAYAAARDWPAALAPLYQAWRV
ncbi:MAG TPA: glycosyltransferase family 1 protein, partial [Vicinamibacterales bacterium]|nr:glycosyltransferase family 1 protein [Vicinamibacterales bacterium]